jgi:hypothetical protein
MLDGGGPTASGRPAARRLPEESLGYLWSVPRMAPPANSLVWTLT